MPEYRLHYFDFTGRAEIARYMFHAAGVQFDDVRYTEEQWAEFKPKTPFALLPVLEIDDRMFGESHAIYKYLANEFGFYGKDNIDRLQVDVVLDLMKETEPFILEAFFDEPDEKKREELKVKGYKEDVPQYLRKNEHLINDKGYFVGEELTVADIAVFDLTNFFMRRDSNLMAPYPRLQANREKVASNPGIAAYMRTRNE